MGKAYPDEARNRVRQLLQQDVAEDDIEKQTGVSDRTIRRWKLELERYGRIGKPPESRTGRHRVMNKEVEQALFDRVATKPDMSVDDMLWWLYDTYKLVVGTRTIRRAFERRNTSHKKFRSNVRNEQQHQQQQQPALSEHHHQQLPLSEHHHRQLPLPDHHQEQLLPEHHQQLPLPDHHQHQPLPEHQQLPLPPHQQSLLPEHHQQLSLPQHQQLPLPEHHLQQPNPDPLPLSNSMPDDQPLTNQHMPVSQPDTTYQSPYAPLMQIPDSHQPPDISPDLARALTGLSDQNLHPDLLPDPVELSEDEETLQLQLQQIMLQKKEVELKLKMRRLMRQRRESQTPNESSLFDHLDVDPEPNPTANPDPSPFDTTPAPKPRDSRSKSKVEEARKRTEERQERMLKDLERRSRRREHLTAEWVQSRDVWAKGPEKLLIELMHQHSTYAYNQNSLETFEAIFRELYRLVDHTEWYPPVHDDLLRERTRRKMSQLRTKMVKSGEIVSRGEGYGGWTKQNEDDGDAMPGATENDNSPFDHMTGLPLDLQPQDSNDNDEDDTMFDQQPLLQSTNDLHHTDFDQDQLARHQHEMLAQRGIAHQEHLSHQDHMSHQDHLSHQDQLSHQRAIEETMAAGLAQQDSMTL